ncbi:MAG: alkaline phosphatase family protein [Thermoanaerobaculia bacterium]|nr:alkaline phosphatase family protein [Thermoanaerobaculia bacterium]
MRHCTSAAAIALSLAILAGAIGCAPDAASPPASSPRILLLGMDGLDPLILERMMAEDRLPAFARLRREGAFGRLRSQEPLLSPLIWTTIVTGRTPPDHGVLDFVEASSSGELVPTTSHRRRVPALWNLASDAGLRSGFVGWYATYPAEDVAGFQVSDRIAYHQVRTGAADVVTGLTHPADLGAWLRDTCGGAQIDLETTRERFLDEPDLDLSDDGAKRLERLAEISATAELYRRSAPALVERFGPDLLGVYFELVDACGHLFMENAPPRREGISDIDYQAFSGTVERCYVEQDRILSDLLVLAGPETHVLVVSDHGFKSGDARPQTSGRADTGVAGLWHRLDGTILWKGPGVIPGSSVQKASVLDIAPTILALLEIPVSRELPGSILTELFEPENALEMVEVDSYDWTPVPKPPDPPTGLSQTEPGDEALAKLRALGYLGGAAPRFDEDGRTANSHINEGVARTAEGDEDGALRAFSRALSIDPRHTQAIAQASRLLIARSDLDRAEDLLGRADLRSPHSVFVHLEQAHLALRRGAWDDAKSALDQARALDGNLLHLAMYEAQWANAVGATDEALAALAQAESLTDVDTMLLEIRLFRARIAAEAGRIAVAEAALDRARALSPAEEDLETARGEIALAGGRFGDAAAHFAAALQRNADDIILARKLAQAHLGGRRLSAAEAALRNALETAKHPVDRAGVFGDLSLVLQQHGDDGGVIQLLVSATAELPDAANLWSLLGAAYGRSGDLEAAMTAYERSVAIDDHPLALKTLAALVLHLRGDRRLAMELLRRSLLVDPDQDDARSLLAELSGLS